MFALKLIYNLDAIKLEGNTLYFYFVTAFNLDVQEERQADGFGSRVCLIDIVYGLSSTRTYVGPRSIF